MRAGEKVAWLGVGPFIYVHGQILRETGGSPCVEIAVLPKLHPRAIREWFVRDLE